MFKNKLIAAALAAILTGPAAGDVEKYVIDPGHTYPSLEFSHLGISVWRGKFEQTKGRIALDRAAGTGTVSVVIDTASLDWGLDAMNAYSRKEEWFDVERFPTATYRGEVRFAGGAPERVDGRLTLKGITRPVTLTINLFKCVPHPILKKELCGADAEGELNWSDFGMTKYGEGDTDRVRLRIQVEALKEE